MDGVRHSIVGADGVAIGVLTAGSGPGLLLVHGGMGRLERWEPLWGQLTDRWQVTAVDRRGRASSGDSAPYALSKEYDDIAAIAAAIARDQGGRVDVFGHSYGATCTLGAAAGGAPFRRIALYEPPGPQTVPVEWVERASDFVAKGQFGRAMVSFLTEIIGLTIEQVDQFRDTPGSADVLAIVAATLPREARALTVVDLPRLARSTTCQTLLLVGSASPPWADQITRELSAALPSSEVVVLDGQGHEAIDYAPGLIVDELQRFFGSETLPRRD
jgi:pimeloyl-ACP methyl ester carboxylesterase